ncbi:regulatory signaling modulator protein AmpE [Pseudidiomarina insulisalsae]|uniref:Regulatory signaling modulator protein AmpE n=1 Tax=Pseudidiomarina insulisalsae TaxID=575789 RepID=A0A432YNH8_9GAMM|nr:regulatory signaling modulator protein AmpE [Pseudidiomarina insulisalsae]RUO62500.1 hypothetical protein CWI71_03440 [Pseudidiomarina insulisalsae]
MQLLAILLAYSLERTVTLSRNLHWRRIVLRWQHWQTRQTQMGRGGDAQEKVSEWRQHLLGEVVWAVLPALIISFIVALLDSFLVSFVVGVLALLATMQCREARDAYKAYLEAANSGDDDGCAQQLRILRHAAARHEAASVHELLIWIHLRYYFATLLYYVLFGVFGALVYATLRDMKHPRNKSWKQLQLVVNWLPTRIMSFGFLMVGNFSKALPVWLNSVGNRPQNNFEALAKVANAAEDLTPKHEDDVTSTALTSVALVKRNMLFFIVLLATMTIAGWV